MKKNAQIYFNLHEKIFLANKSKRKLRIQGSLKPELTVI